LECISEVFGEWRSQPLPVGSVKSNMGHCEPVAGVCLCIFILNCIVYFSIIDIK